MGVRHSYSIKPPRTGRGGFLYYAGCTWFYGIFDESLHFYFSQNKIFFILYKAQSAYPC